MEDDSTGVSLFTRKDFYMLGDRRDLTPCDHDFEPVELQSTTKLKILAEMGVNGVLDEHFKDHPMELHIKVCLKCGCVVNEATGFKRLVEEAINRFNLIETCDQLRKKMAKDIFMSKMMNSMMG